MFGIGAQELVVILVVALLVFGPKRLPQLARSLGRGLAEFRRASTDLRQSLQLDVNEGLRSSAQNPPKPAQTRPDFLPDDAAPAMAGADLPDDDETPAASTPPDAAKGDVEEARLAKEDEAADEKARG